MNKEQKWDHGTDRTGRYRGGKTFADKRSGAHAARFANRQRPIRRTSSHSGVSNMAGPQFWGG